MNACIKSKKISAVIAILVLFLSLIMCPGVYAGKKKDSSAPPKSKVTMVQSVDVAGKQLTIMDQGTGQATTYSVDDFTKITLQGNNATLGDIQSGMEVYSYIERSSSVLDDIDVGPVRTDR